MRSIPFVALLTALLIVLTAGAIAFREEEEEERFERPYGRYGPNARAIDYEAAEELATRAFEREGKWMLEPPVFEKLSVAGKRAVLRRYGLLKLPRVGREPLQEARIEPEAANGENQRVNNPAIDELGSSQSESSIAVNGANIVIGFNDASRNASGYAFSTDGGSTFTHQRVPTLVDGQNLGDPVLAFGPNGELYYAMIATNERGESIIAVAKSVDQGRTFAIPVDASTTASKPEDFQDKEWLAVDTSNSSPFRGNLYVSWTSFTETEGAYISFARSTNAGASFETPQIVSRKDLTFAVQGSMPAVAPNGDLYIAFLDLRVRPAGISVVRSTDGGRTFSAPRTAASFNLMKTVPGGNSVRTNSYPSIAVDGSGGVHIVYAAIPSGSTRDRGDIFYVRSTDGANSFTAPRRLNDDTTATTQLLPAIAVAADGTLGVKWWDRRNDPVNDNLTDVYMARSQDGGNSFGKNFRVTDTNWAFGPSEFASYHGDYDDIKAQGNNFFISWSDERNSDPDVFFTQIPADRNGDLPDFNISTMKVFDTLMAGNQVAFELATSAVNGFSGNLSLSAEPAVSGLTYSFSNSSVAPGQRARLLITANNSVAPGTYRITVAASAGTMARKTTLRLSVFDARRINGAPVNASNSSGFTTFQAGMKVDSRGTIHLAFEDDTAVAAFNEGNEVFYSRSTDGGVTYSNPVKISTNSRVSFSSALALDSAGNIAITYSSLSADSIGSSIFFSRSTDGGNSFSPPKLLTPPMQISDLPSIAIDRNNNILVTYADFAVGGPLLFAVRSTDGGANFSAPLQITPSGNGVNGFGYVAFDSRGAAYVVYNDVRSDVATVKLITAADGINFTAPRVVSDVGTAPAFFPHLAVDNSDNIYVTFYNRFGTRVDLFNREIIVIKSSDRGASFSAQLNVSNNRGQSTFPFLVSDRRGNISVVWEDSTDNDQLDIFTARSTNGGMTFSTPVNISLNSGISFGASAAVDASGNLLVAWNDDSTANSELFVSSSAPDFSLIANPAEVSAGIGQSVDIKLLINRSGGSAGNITLRPVDANVAKIKVTPASVMAAGREASFKLKVKKTATPGAKQLTFSGRDESGRTRQATVIVNVQ